MMPDAGAAALTSKGDRRRKVAIALPFASALVRGKTRLGERVPLYWFHSFKRQTPSEILDDLQKGATWNPSTQCTTATNENDLGISRHTYAYLGRGHTNFGGTTFCLPIDAFDRDGDLSPFDSGGLVHFIQPLCGGARDQRRDYLQSFSFPGSQRRARLEQYPADVVAYLDESTKPAQSGPHEVLGGGPNDPIWRDNSDWRAWTWEGRMGRRLETTHIRHWTCAPDLYPLLRRAASTLDRQGKTWFLRFDKMYIHGGLTALVRRLRNEQTRS